MKTTYQRKKARICLYRLEKRVKMETYKRIGSKIEHTVTIEPVTKEETNVELRMYFIESGDIQVFPMLMKKNIHTLREELLLIGYSLVDS